ncbi:hypothetical protein BGZ59_004752 [Podila verticillata]|nr:hypothetical protein BGZ59_004752 [Podila verticillata]KAI9231821.1 MAG: N-acetylglucosaminyltransferase-like protein [Podila humilis]KFH72571.1 hypothetical protein MVEG_02860 [Podila verticillata NRRL 6337]
MAVRLLRRNIVLCLVALIMVLMVFQRRLHFAIIDFGYLIRPLWDKEIGSFDTIIPHYYAEGMLMKERCEAHGWTYPTDPKRVVPKVYDALVFSVELDMLEIRINELWNVVDYFIILEANVTFTGLYKELTFAKNRERFAFAESKIIYKQLHIPILENEGAWDREGRMRVGMTDLFNEIPLKEGDIFTSSDLDEVVYAHTIDLYKSCDNVPSALHLQLKHYIYSYEFPTGETIWKTFVQKWTPGARTFRSQASTVLLTDAGWHCSFCFRFIKDFQFKVHAYSHADRVRYDYMATPEWIQRKICDGADLFGMFPEAYNFKDLFNRLGSIRKSQTALHLPKFLLENKKRFRFLLPGGCVREDAPKKF